MAGVTKEELQKEINDILKDADLTKMSAKKVRQQLEEKLGCELLSRKKEIDSLVMDFVNSKVKDEESEEEEEDDESEESEKDEPKKRSGSGRDGPPKKKKKTSSGDEDDGGSGGGGSGVSEDEYSPKKSTPKPTKKRSGRKKKGSDSDSDEDWKKPKKAAPKKGAGKGKGTGFTRPLTLSPELASLMGAESLPRHEVVKKMWAMIKERNLYDPKNKQYAICDNDLLKVIGVKRFRTFGMLKYLRQHFID